MPFSCEASTAFFTILSIMRCNSLMSVRMGTSSPQSLVIDILQLKFWAVEHSEILASSMKLLTVMSVGRSVSDLFSAFITSFWYDMLLITCSLSFFTSRSSSSSGSSSSSCTKPLSAPIRFSTSWKNTLSMICFCLRADISTANTVAYLFPARLKGVTVFSMDSLVLSFSNSVHSSTTTLFMSSAFFTAFRSLHCLQYSCIPHPPSPLAALMQLRKSPGRIRFPSESYTSLLLTDMRLSSSSTTKTKELDALSARSLSSMRSMVSSKSVVCSIVSVQ